MAKVREEIMAKMKSEALAESALDKERKKKKSKKMNVYNMSELV